MGRVTASSKLVLSSLMPMNGVVFSDGIESDALAFNAGTELTIGLADIRGCLVSR
ncbi:MAG: hypothetical protein LAT65_17290 [Saccharospirillum sp.]|nr:hypothetical protein [Saccharospirillum sp.]